MHNLMRKKIPISICTFVLLLIPNLVCAELDEARIREIVREEMGHGWVKSIKNMDYKLGFTLETEWNWSEHDAADEAKVTDSGPVDLSTSHANSYIAVDKFAFYLRAKYGDSVHFKADLEAPAGANLQLDEYRLKFVFPHGMMLDVGLDERIMKDGGFGTEFESKKYKFNRYTESYALTGVPMYVDEQHKFTFAYSQKEVPVYGAVWVGTGLDLGSRTVMSGNDNGNNNANKMIQDDNYSNMDNQSTEYGAALGFKLEPVEKALRFNLLAAYMQSKADVEDVAFLTTYVSGQTGNNDTKSRLFGRIHFWIMENWEIVGECVAMKDGLWKRNAWSAQTSYNIKNDDPLKLGETEMFLSFTPVIRYSDYDVDQGQLIAANRDALTWSRKQWNFCLSTQLVQNIRVTFEYNRNIESDTFYGTRNVGEIANDEFVSRFQIRF